MVVVVVVVVVCGVCAYVVVVRDVRVRVATSNPVCLKTEKNASMTIRTEGKRMI